MPSEIPSLGGGVVGFLCATEAFGVVWAVVRGAPAVVDDLLEDAFDLVVSISFPSSSTRTSITSSTTSTSSEGPADAGDDDEEDVDDFEEEPADDPDDDDDDDEYETRHTTNPSLSSLRTNPRERAKRKWLPT